MSSKNYDAFKTALGLYIIPATILEVHKNFDGSCGDIYLYAVNDKFADNYKHVFNAASTIESIEGSLYHTHMPREPKFEDICFRSAWKKERIHTYVDTSKMYGYWTEDFLLPIDPVEAPKKGNVAYCLFMFTLSKVMNAGRFSSVSPDIANFVIKTCLNLRTDEDFYQRMDVVTKDIRKFCDSYSCCIMTVTPDMYKFDIISEAVRNNEISIREIFKNIPYEVVETWEWLIGETNSIIITDKNDFNYYTEKSPEWVESLHRNNVESLVLVPFIYQNAIIGYLYITNFDIDEVVKVKETLELVSFFLSSETANHMIMERLEYLSNVDMLTGVFNRNSMNTAVDELSTKLTLNPIPFSVAFCDLNGLKSINDNDGHENGDQLLKDAAKVLKEVFTGDQIYRAGGDEFTIISLGGTEEEFKKKIELLKEKASDPDWLYFAIGYYHDPSEGMLRLAMRYADEAMYKDKDAYYEAHPDKRR